MVEQQKSKQRGVLLICYSEETLSALVAILRQAGESAMAPPSITDAWSCIKSDCVGCVVLDLTGPGAEALGFFRTARTSYKSSQIPFLFLVGGPEELPQLESYGRDLTPDAWLVLPCPAEVFLGKIHGLLTRQPERHLAGLSSSGMPGISSGGLKRASLNAAPAAEQAAAMSTPAPHHPGGAAGASTVIQPDELLKTQGMFAGRLGTLDVTKIVGMIEPLRLTGVLRLSDGKRYGQIHFIEGAVRHAELHDIEGADALFLLFHLKNGAFRFDLEEPTTKRSIEGNTMALLLEGLRQMDEAKAIIKSFQQSRGAGSAPASEQTPAAKP